MCSCVMLRDIKEGENIILLILHGILVVEVSFEVKNCNSS